MRGHEIKLNNLRLLSSTSEHENVVIFFLGEVDSHREYETNLAETNEVYMNGNNCPQTLIIVRKTNDQLRQSLSGSICFELVADFPRLPKYTVRDEESQLSFD